ncbi:archaellin/type IV pilin N-terminal domain-containing protein [Natrarchaeobius sp. A-rgal3]|uniref:archaellin/type IV pilin N-terminal domain-containing protein n=1 Tax=Natrarchaeobius versutus TaxID=1679078 RepID=UPI00350F304C
MSAHHSPPVDRGQTGLGTLIVFVSMVIIAALAAGVLINTTGHAQSHADATGEESTQQVADRVQVLNAVGYTGASIDEFEQTDPEAPLEENELHRLELTVQPAPGVGTLTFDDATIEFLGSDIETLTYVEVDDFDENDFDSTLTLDADDSNFFTIREYGTQDGTNALAREHRGVVVIPLGTYDEDETDWTDDSDFEQPERLTAGDTAEVTIIMAQGSQTTVVLEVPGTLRGNEPAISL